MNICNFRALKCVTIDMSSFNCIIGENNTGKSSLMHAVQSFLDGKKLKESDYYNLENPVIITTEFKVSENDLSLIVNEDHRSRTNELVLDNKLTLTRSFPLDDKVILTCSKLVPKEAKWNDNEVNDTVSGKRGAELKDAINEKYPEIESEINSIGSSITQIIVKEIIGQYIGNLPPEELEWNHFCDIPTGIPASVESLLPVPIFIPAVKDISEDLKTTDKALFGQLLGIVLSGIQDEEEMEEFNRALEELDKKLNIIEGEDNRFPQIQNIESKIEDNIRENFKNVDVNIEIPPPDLKKVLQSAEIKITEGGIKGGVETKGDGLKRAVLFSLFKSLAQLKNSDSRPENDSNYVILFEEPELYLHPNAQQIVFDSLFVISGTYQTVITTHSPLFFSARKGFAKLIKYDNQNETPYSELISVDVENDLNIKDEFQILCFENNNVAFFAEKVVLVEGDSDLHALKHIAFTIKSDWDFDKGKIRMIKVEGKGNFLRFKRFFKKFQIKTYIIADLDILISGFNQLDLPPDSSLKQERNVLISNASSYITEPEYSSEDIQETWKENGPRIIEIINKAYSGEVISQEECDYLEDIEKKLQHNKACLKILRELEGVKESKQILLKKLREKNIFILEKGCIENYYPESITGNKIEKAESFRKNITTKNEILSFAPEVLSESGVNNEFLEIFSKVFN